LIVFLFTTVHESIHGTAFRSAWINVAVANVCGFLILLPPKWFRYFHFAHHRHTHDPDRDPELAKPKPRTVVRYLVYLSGLSYWRGQARALAINAAGMNGDDFVPAKRRRDLAVEARRFVLAYVAAGGLSAVLANDVLLWTWLVPVIVGQPFLRAYLLAEHTLCPHVVNMLENSRTTFTNGLVRWIAWNMPYHAEHHAYPAVPFHKLPAFHKMTKKYLGTTAKGYTRFQGRLLATFGSGENE
jgi:fatty acid desaturase